MSFGNGEVAVSIGCDEGNESSRKDSAEGLCQLFEELYRNVGSYCWLMVAIGKESDSRLT